MALNITGKVGWWSGSVGVAPAGIITNGLILNLDAGNASSYPGTGTTWTDLSGQNNNGTLVNGVGYSSVNGGALTFDGVNDYVNMGSNSTFNLLNLSVSSWVKPTTGGDTFTPIISRYSNNSGTSGWFIYYDKSTNKFYVDGRESLAATLSISTNNTYTINNWYNVMWTKSGSSWSLYINGVLDRTLTLGNGTTTFPLESMQIGALQVIGGGLYYGKQDISTANIYNRALSDAEVLQNYNVTKTRFGL